MIKRDRIKKIWSGIIGRLIALMVFGIFILLSIVIHRFQTSSSPEFGDLFIGSIVLTVAAGLFYFVAGLIKREVWRRYGED